MNDWVTRVVKKARPLNDAVCLVSAALLTASLAGCTVGPRYHRPSVQTPAAYHNADPQAQAQAASFAVLPWWQVFKDP
jgi:hypothetical protein